MLREISSWFSEFVSITSELKGMGERKMIKKVSFLGDFTIFPMYFMGASDPQMIEKFANFGVPAVLLIYFIYYSSKIYNQLSAAILRQGEENSKAIIAVVERFDRALERHETTVSNISQTTAKLAGEIARGSAALQSSIQNLAETVKSVAEADRNSHDMVREMLIRLQARNDMER